MEGSGDVMMSYLPNSKKEMKDEEKKEGGNQLIKKKKRFFFFSFFLFSFFFFFSKRIDVNWAQQHLTKRRRKDKHDVWLGGNESFIQKGWRVFL